MPTKIEKGIARIAKLDVKEQELDREAKGIAHSMPYGQSPPVYGRVLDKVNVIRAKKAKIWNEIRNFILPGTQKTLWQIAVADKRLPTVWHGKEHHLDFFASDIKKAIKDFKMVSFKIPIGMTLQKSLTKTGGQMHFKNGGGKKKPKSLSASKTNKRVKRIKKGSDNLGTFGINIKTLEDMMR